MEIKEAYNTWADQYDNNENRTRDLEAVSLRTMLSRFEFDTCLEIGCGTGKNTEWIVSKAKKVMAVDLSQAMLAKAKSKVVSDKVQFIEADIRLDWTFANKHKFDLATFSLVLEHIEELDDIFDKLRNVLSHNAYVYVGELHPFKQYNGTKARFETENGLQVVPCFNHHISDFTSAAGKSGFKIIEVNEYFDENDRTSIPRILALRFKKEESQPCA